MPRLVAGNPDGGGRGIAENIVGKPDDIGSGVKMVCQVAADPFNADISHAMGGQNPTGGLRAGKPPGGKLAGILLKGGIDIGAGPQGQ